MTNTKTLNGKKVIKTAQYFPFSRKNSHTYEQILEGQTPVLS